MENPGHFGRLGEAMAGNGDVAVIFANGRGEVCFWNAGAEALFGHAVGDVAGQRIDIVVPHALRDAHWAGFNRTIGSTWRGTGGWGPIEALHKSGMPVALEVFLTPMNGVDGRVAGVMALFRRPVSP